MMDRSNQPSMRAVAMCSILLTALLVPLVGATHSNIGETTTGWASLSDSQDHPIIDTYSPIIQASIAHHSDVTIYSEDQLSAVQQWVVFSNHNLGVDAGHLRGAQLVDFNNQEAQSVLHDWQTSGLIEAAYPLIERDMEPRWTPNDPKFGEQWHLVNTGQTGGVSGE
ncbi:MAG TPA: hypothetical protein D7H89_00420, partial [Candidatus Poseidoniales archaeon]